MRAWSAATLLTILIASVLTAWVPQRWPASIIEVGSFGLALAWIVKLAISGTWPRFDRVLLPVAFIVFWGAVQIACGWMAAQSETVRATLSWGANLAILFAGIQTFDEHPVRERFLRTLLWSGLLISVVAILQIFSANGKVFWVFAVTDPQYVMGPFVYHNHYAAFIEAVLPLVLLAALQERDKRLWFAFAAATMIASVIVSASRSGFVLIVIETATVIVASQWRSGAHWRRIIPALGLMLVTTAVVTVMAGWDALAKRLGEQHAYYDRLQMFYSSIDMFRDHVWRGVGLGNWAVVFPSYARYDDGLFANQAHNDWVQAAAEGGIALLAAFAVVFAYTLRAALREVWCIGLVFVFIHALVDYPFHKPQIAALVFAVLAAGVAGQGRGAGAFTSPERLNVGAAK